ncbi:hypothetical protein V7S43_018633 [Phytophthora oleae]|uniref:Uncharacterized protein n=1 Tax=Phytophthora oleae TaxID=2107226 RepID=A0ABD3ETA6_9STRA
MEANLPVLTSARCLVKHCLPDGKLPHIVYRVNEFLDDFSIDWTIIDAYKRTGTVRFMQYVAAREDPNEMNAFYCRWLFNAAS